MIVQVESRSADELTEEVWRFALVNDNVLFLHYYGLHKRATYRHKWQTEKSYHFQEHRVQQMSVDEIPKPEWVVEDAKRQVYESLKVEWTR